MTQAKQRLTAEARRQAVLDTAGRVFSRSSYRGATTAEIAREAGISEPILYRHFGSKRDLYLACLDEAWASFRAGSERAIAEDPLKCLGAIADAYMSKGKKIRLIDLWIQALTVSAEDKVIAAALRRQVREVHDFFAELIRDGQQPRGAARRPRSRGRGLALRRRRPARDDGQPPRRPARRRPPAGARRAPPLDGRRSHGLRAPGRKTDRPARPPAQRAGGLRGGRPTRCSS